MQVIASTEKFDNIVVVTIRERLDVFSAEQLMEEFNTLLREGAVHFIVDLTYVCGLSMLMVIILFYTFSNVPRKLGEC